jgi:hypothetical protein
MAKLKGPLFSLGASQQLGKALVYFPWKGLNLVREYVIPSNPQTTAQNTHRAYLTAAVAAIHTAQADGTNPLGALDVAAFNLLGSTRPTPRTWFNEIVKQWLDQKVASKIPVMFRSINPVATSGDIQMKGQMTQESGTPVAGELRYGTSKTALINTKACSKTQLEGGIHITGLTNGIKYFIQYRCMSPDPFIGSNSGIYYATPRA